MNELIITIVLSQVENEPSEVTIDSATLNGEVLLWHKNPRLFLSIEKALELYPPKPGHQYHEDSN